MGVAQQFTDERYFSVVTKGYFLYPQPIVLIKFMTLSTQVSSEGSDVCLLTQELNWTVFRRRKMRLLKNENICRFLNNDCVAIIPFHGVVDHSLTYATIYGFLSKNCQYDPYSQDFLS